MQETCDFSRTDFLILDSSDKQLVPVTGWVKSIWSCITCSKLWFSAHCSSAEHSHHDLEHQTDFQLCEILFTPTSYINNFTSDVGLEQTLHAVFLTVVCCWPHAMWLGCFSCSQIWRLLVCLVIGFVCLFLKTFLEINSLQRFEREYVSVSSLALSGPGWLCSLRMLPQISTQYENGKSISSTNWWLQ